MMSLNVWEDTLSDQILTLPLEEEVKVTDEMHESILSVVLSFLSVNAQERSHKCDRKRGKRYDGEEMFKFYKTPNCVDCSKLYYLYLIEVFLQFMDRYEAGNITAQLLLDIKNILHLIKVNTQSIILCRIDIKKLLNEDELS